VRICMRDALVLFKVIEGFYKINYLVTLDLMMI
jgi:hypothetical protein